MMVHHTQGQRRSSQRPVLERRRETPTKHRHRSRHSSSLQGHQKRMEVRTLLRSFPQQVQEQSPSGLYTNANRERNPKKLATQDWQSRKSHMPMRREVHGPPPHLPLPGMDPQTPEPDRRQKGVGRLRPTDLDQNGPGGGGRFRRREGVVLNIV